VALALAQSLRVTTQLVPRDPRSGSPQSYLHNKQLPFYSPCSLLWGHHWEQSFLIITAAQTVDYVDCDYMLHMESYSHSDLKHWGGSTKTSSSVNNGSALTEA
jgi:hypothetical protein